MITSITLPKSFDSYQMGQSPLKEFGPMSRINMLVGSNNAGKSRFMRQLATIKQYEVTDSAVDIEVINGKLSVVLDRFQNELSARQLRKAEDVDVEEIQRLRELPTRLQAGQDVYQGIRSRFERWGRIQSINTTGSLGSMGLGYSNTEGLAQKFREIAAEGLAVLADLPDRATPASPKRVYIPILRGLRPLDEDRTDFYARKTIEDYFSDQKSEDPPRIFTGLSFYQDLMESLLGGNVDRKQISEYQKFLSRRLFEGRDVVLVPSQKTPKVVTIKIGNETERPVHDLGDGLQSAIILSYLPFISNEPTFFFVEEPESHMHPGFQRKILELFNASEEHTFFLTTHSNHLLDITIDMKSTSVFTFKKSIDHNAADDEQVARFQIVSVNIGESSSLEELGVRNSSVFLVNATVWVEGITDGWYLRAYLKLYSEYVRKIDAGAFLPEEDVHFSFIEYGGANITHFSFLDHETHPIEVDRLCAKAMVVIDQDGDSKLPRKAALEAKLGERLQVLTAREIENTLPSAVIREVVASYENNSSPIPKFPEQGGYKGEYLGHFIEEWLKNSIGMTRRGGYKAPSGTLKDKTGFCEKAVCVLNEWHFEDLPDDTKELARKVYEFIRLAN